MSELHAEYDMEELNKIDFDKLLLEHEELSNDMHIIGDFILLEMRRPNADSYVHKERLIYLEKHYQSFLKLRSEIAKIELELCKARNKAIRELEEIREYLEKQNKEFGIVELPDYEGDY
jgi:hypothetical protein